MSIKSAWLSKINWTQAIGLLAMLATFLGYTVPPDVQTAALTGIGAIMAVVTWVLKTFFTASITPASAANAKP